MKLYFNLLKLSSMTTAKPFNAPNRTTMLTAQVLQDIKDVLAKQKSNKMVILDAESTNEYYWAMFDPLDKDQWFDEDYGDIRDMPSFATGIAYDKSKVLEQLKNRGVIQKIKVNSVKEDPLDMGWKDYEVIKSFEVELHLSKFLKYYDSYIKAAKPALSEYLIRSGQASTNEAAGLNPVEQKTDNIAKVSLNSATRTIRLTVAGTTKNVHKFRSKQDANYIIFKNLTLYPDRAMTKKDLGVPRILSPLKDIPKTMGFKGELKSIFFTIDTKDKTLTLHPNKLLTNDELEILSHYVNSNND